MFVFDDWKFESFGAIWFSEVFYKLKDKDRISKYVFCEACCLIVYGAGEVLFKLDFGESSDI